MSKYEMIEAIQNHNPSADLNFLDAFDEQDLVTYLRRLTELKDRRGPDTVWVRDPEPQMLSGATLYGF